MLLQCRKQWFLTGRRYGSGHARPPWSSATVYRMAKSRERKTRNIIQVKCIKDVTKQLLTKDEDIKNRWWEYFDKLFNEDSGSSSIKLDISSDALNRQFVYRIQESKIKDALKRMKGGDMMSSDGIPIEV
jgi:hypothetical protein